MVQLPAHNTPQFEWGKNHMPMQPQPVPPIFDPEMAAKAIFWAAAHNRREIHLGLPTVKAIWANKFFPGSIDRYLARTGYSGQQSERPADPNNPDNLWHPVKGNYAAQGRFGNRSSLGSLQLWFTIYLTPILLIFLMAALGIIVYWNKVA